VQHSVKLGTRQRHVLPSVKHSAKGALLFRKFLISPTVLSKNSPVWIYFSENRLFHKLDFLRSRFFLENLMSKKSGVFGNPNFLTDSRLEERAGSHGME
jgi:hypothetical protein